MDRPSPQPNLAAHDRSLDHVLSRVPLEVATSETWTRVALADLPALLEDHCQCELKAASSALSLIGRNPWRDLLAESMLRLAREETRHYRQIREIMAARGIAHHPPRRSPYVAGLQAGNRGGDLALLDALVVSAVVEARSCERFVALARALGSGPKDVDAADELGALYRTLAGSESGHAHVFVELAREYYEPDLVASELARRLDLEARVLRTIPVTPRMHGGNGDDGGRLSRPAS